MIVIKGSEAENKEYVLKCLKRLDHENLRSNLPKCRFSKLEICRRNFKKPWIILSLV